MSSKHESVQNSENIAASGPKMPSKGKSPPGMIARFFTLKTKPKILISTGIPLVLLAILGSVSVYNVDKLTTTSKWVDHTRVVLAEAASIVGSAVDMETGMRGYLLAGQDGFLTPYRDGEVATYDRIANLQETVNDNPRQVKRLADAENVLREWQSQVTEPTIGLRRDIGSADTMNDMAALVGEAGGKVFFDKFRQQISTFIEREQKLLDQRQVELEAAGTQVAENRATLNEALNWIDHTYKVVVAAKEIIAAAVDMETGYRGYMLAGKKVFLEPFNVNRERFFIDIKALKEIVSDNPAQVERLKEAESLITDWIANVIEPGIALRMRLARGSATLQEIEAYIAAEKGKVFFDAFRGLLNTFAETESELIGQRQADADTADASMTEAMQIMNEAQNWTVHTYKVIARANDIIAAAVDMETGMRGYLLAGQESFLDPYNAGSKRFLAQVSELSQTVGDNPTQVKLLKEVKVTIANWHKDITEPMIALRRQIGDAKTMDDMADLIAEARGKTYFDQFRKIMADFSAEEKGLIEARIASNEATVSTTYWMIGLCVALAIAIGTVLAWIVGSGIANPITRMTAAMRTLAGGDIAVDIPCTQRYDEIGDIARATEVFKENAIETEVLRQERAEQDKLAAEEKRQQMEELATNFESSVGSVISTVSSAASQLQQTAQSMTEIASQTNDQATAAASASEEASNNVQTVASAAEELSASISEISGQINDSNEISQKAVSHADKTNEEVKGLAEAATKIDDVVELISDIAEQTNLLALNATIEAARAGDAGKGFAVVANEVKSLASQTAKATEEISQQISNTQAATTGVVKSIGEITDVIRQISENATAVATAVEEQSASTQEITRNVHQAAAGTQDVSKNVAGTLEGAEASGTAASQVLSAAGDLSQQSEVLRGEVEKFVSSLRVA